MYLSRIKIAAGLITILIPVVLIFHCELPQDPNAPNNTKVELVIRNSRWVQSNHSITDTVGNPIQIGLAIHLPEYIDSIRLLIQSEEERVFDTTIRSFAATKNDTVWKQLSFPIAGNKSISVTPFSSSVKLARISGNIIIVADKTPVDPQVNHAPEWTIDKVFATISDTTLYKLMLSSICFDADGDSVRYVISGEDLPGDTIIGGQYLFQATPSTAGINIVKLVASDPGGASNTIILELTVFATRTVDTIPPEVTIISPADSSVTSGENCLVDLICSDQSGIESVYGSFGGKIFPAIFENGHYKITIEALVPGVFNTITITVRDASSNSLTTTKILNIKRIQKFTVIYSGNGSTSGTVPFDTVKYESGATVMVKSNTGNLAKTGHTFAGWNTAADGSGTAYAAGTTFAMGSADVTLFAQWTLKSYTVQFNTQGGSSVDQVQVNHGGTVPQPPNPIRTGYTFGGWYKESECINAWNFTSMTVSEDMTLYAKWTIKTFTVKFNSQGGSAVDSQKVNYGEKVSKPADPKGTGYTFGGWYMDESCTNPWLFSTDVVTGPLTLYAKWTINQYTVTFNSQGGNNVASQTVNYGGHATPPANPKRDCYTFGGWYKEAGCINQWLFADDLVTGPLTLYAKWTLTPLTIIPAEGTLTNTCGTGGSSNLSLTVQTLPSSCASGYEWHGYTSESDDAVITNDSYHTGATTATLTFTNLKGWGYFYCIVTDTEGNRYKSGTWAVTICP